MSAPLRIALLVHGWPPERAAGVELHAQAMARALARLGHAVEVLCAAECESSAHLASERRDEQGVGVTRLHLRRPRDPREAQEPEGVEEAVVAWLAAVDPGLILFEHSIHLGLGALRAAARHGAPVVHRAHDHWLVSPQYLGARPDLAPMAPNDSVQLARIDLLRELEPDLARGLGCSFLLDGLEPARRARVLALFEGGEGELLAQGVDPARHRAAVEGRRALQHRRREALRGVDLVLSPTRELARTLRACGLPTEIEVLPCGIEDRGLGTLAAPRRSGPLRLAFLGTLAAHKGLATLLEAVHGLEGVVLAVHGQGDDRAAVERLAARALELGVEWRGPFAASDVAGVLSACDALILPSMWPEVAPFVLLEARAARRPVVVSRVGGVHELVEDGREALFAAAGDPAELRAAIVRLRDEPGLLERLSRGSATPPSIDEEARLVVERALACAAPRAARRRARRAPPPAVAAFAARIAALRSTSIDELGARTLEGIHKARKLLLSEEGPPATALLRAARRAEAAADAARAAEEGARSRERHAESAFDAARAEAAWLRSEVAAKGVEAAAMRAERDAALADGASLRAECAWRAESLRAAQEESRSLASALDDLARRYEDLRARSAASEAAAAVAEELAALRAEAEWSRGLRATLEAEVQWRRELDEARLAAIARVESSLAREAELARRQQAELDLRAEALRAAAESVEALRGESAWRAGQMELVRASLSRARFALLAPALRKWVLRWPSSGGGA